jgi:hypothetical protein
MKFSTIFICIFLIISQLSFSQKGSLSVKVDKDTVFQDELITVEFLLDNVSGNFTAPDFSGFRIVSGPNTSSSFSMINGVVNQKKSYSYMLVPQATGDQQIGEAIVVNEGDKLITDPVSVYVLPLDKTTSSGKSKQRIYRYDALGNKKDSTKTPPLKKRVLKKI